MILDQYQDKNGQLLNKLAKLFLADVPPHEKQAAITDKDSAPSGLFADPTARTFPCINKEATFLSALYFFGQQGLGDNYKGPTPQDVVGDRIIKSAKKWGILDKVAELKQRIMEKTAVKELTDNDYALIIQDGRVEQKLLPINTPANIKYAVANFSRMLGSKPYAMRKVAARNILDAVMDLNVSLDRYEDMDDVIKTSGRIIKEQEELHKDMMNWSYCWQPDIRAYVQKAAAAVKDTALRPEDAEELCEALYKLGIRHDMERPESVIFGGLVEKAASEDKDVMLTTGKPVKLSRLIKLSAQDIRETLGDAICDAVINDAGVVDSDKACRVFPTLPRDMATVVAHKCS